MISRTISTPIFRSIKTGLKPTVFAMTWKTDNAGTSSATQITIPTITGATYTCVVDWGDGTSNTITTFNDAAWTHTYALAGTYQVTIEGVFGRIYFNDSGDKLKLLSVDQWGTTATWSSFARAFFGCANCEFHATDALVLPWNCDQAFRACTKFNQPVSSWNTAAVSNMPYMFDGCTAFNQSMANFNTANATSMFAMFLSCASFNQSVANFNTAKVTNMSNMFNGCTAFNQSVASFNTAIVTSMASMFRNCAAFNQSVANFNTANLLSLSYTFAGCTAFNQSVAAFNTVKVTNMQNTFNGCTVFKQSLATFSLVALAGVTDLWQFAFATDINATETTTNLDGTLVAWAAQLPLPRSYSPSFGTAKYSTATGKPAYDALVAAGWTVLTGGAI